MTGAPPTTMKASVLGASAANPKWVNVLGVVIAFVAAIVLIASVPILLQTWGVYGYHQKPWPEGAIARYELPESTSMFARPDVTPVRAADTWEIWVDGGRVAVFDAPTGARSAGFDFNGDGVEDTLSSDAKGGADTLTVFDGKSGSVLFTNRDPQAYTPSDRGFPLPDLDGDGASELAVYHPREIRSYDFHLVDRVIDVKSWLTIVSYDP